MLVLNMALQLSPDLGVPPGLLLAYLGVAAVVSFALYVVIDVLRYRSVPSLDVPLTDGEALAVVAHCLPCLALTVPTVQMKPVKLWLGSAMCLHQLFPKKKYRAMTPAPCSCWVTLRPCPLQR
jgi:hypothetical protein